MREWLYSGNSAPIGQNAATNMERYNNPQTDQLLNQYGSTTDPATQKQIMGQLEQVMLQQVPIIPVTSLDTWKVYWDEGYQKGSRPGICHIFVHEPIETKGLTVDDADALRDRVHAIISKKFNDGNR